MQVILKEIKEPSESPSLLLDHIIKTIRLNPDETIEVKLTNTQRLIEEFNKVIANTIQIDNTIIDSLEDEYYSKWKGTVCDRYMTEYITSLKIIQTQKRIEWLKRNVQSVRNSIDTMTVSQCVQWQSSMSDLPDFLDEKDLEDIAYLSSKVTKKIKEQRISGVVEMFSALSDDEKKECLNILTGRK